MCRSLEPKAMKRVSAEVRVNCRSRRGLVRNVQTIGFDLFTLLFSARTPNYEIGNRKGFLRYVMAYSYRSTTMESH